MQQQDSQQPNSDHLTSASAQGRTGETSRSDHLAWCKTRALECIDAGDVQGAFASMASDLRKHPETERHIGIELGLLQLMSGMLDSPAAMKRFIEGFN